MSLPLNFPVLASTPVPPVPAGFASWTAYYEKNGWNTGITGANTTNPGIAMDAALVGASSAPTPAAPPAPEANPPPAPRPSSVAPRNAAPLALIACGILGLAAIAWIVLPRPRRRRA